MSAFVYIMASQRNGTLYVGVTNDLVRRVWEHRQGQVDGFTKQHGVKMLVHYEQHDNFESAITREKALKKWNRKWKLNLIEKGNPNWNDLYDEVCR
ncbi:GIY-YIG nuclease family protein [Maritalea mediterranea]|uniref:GIY-YIG nuclease family protein n=1 Tax=Maritalea mediterranea TaxID=2909667 RepID=A0ABS9E9G4_9HYPH|nr:GIY-YIG nuclease family protein [Maritalea mediterranea]MCF4098844.1 GIY-YIG nuclease family protein [Maritalea mediterranea]